MLIGLNKQVGYFAMHSDSAYCTGEYCVIAGTKNALVQYLKEDGIYDCHPKIKKTTFGQIMQGMMSGGGYAFDRLGYDKFYALAIKNKGSPPVSVAA